MTSGPASTNRAGDALPQISCLSQIVEFLGVDSLDLLEKQLRVSSRRSGKQPELSLDSQVPARFQLVSAARRARLSAMLAIEKGSFFQRTRSARKVMVLDLGFLGDTVHLLPALWMVRQAYPHAELHVAVAANVTSFMDCAPWVNRVWGYMRYPRHATLRENWQMISRLRREKFDVLINLNGSDRSSWLSLLSGARERLGRVPDDGGPWFWRRMFTAHVECPRAAEPVYFLKCRSLAKAGFPFTQPEFHIEIPAENLRAAEICRSRRRNVFSYQPVHDRRLQGTAAGTTRGIHRRIGKKFS